jgi:hypothetical protein
MLFDDQQKAPELLADIARWYGLGGFSMDARIDKNEIGLLTLGKMDKGLSLEDIMYILEGSDIHYSI